MKNIYEITQNKKGICGFVSMAQLIIDYDKMTLQQYEQKHGTDGIKYTQEWMDIQINHDERLKTEGTLDFTATSLNQCLAFTEDFGDKYKYTVTDLQNGKWEGLGLIPEAICDYLDRRYGLKMGIEIYDNKSVNDLWQSTTNNLGNGIYGLRKSAAMNTVKDSQLSHYVHIDKAGNLMTWGKQNEEANKAITGLYEQVIVRLFPK